MAATKFQGSMLYAEMAINYVTMFSNNIYYPFTLKYKIRYVLLTRHTIGGHTFIT